MHKVSIESNEDNTIMEFKNSEGDVSGRLFYSPSNKIKFEGELEASVRQFVELVEIYLT